MLFRGLSAFPITPADANGTVDTEALSRLLARLDVDGIDSVGLLGSTGTYMYLDQTQRRRAVAAARETLGGRIPVMAGVGALRTDDACALARDAEAGGADGLLLAPVSYTPLFPDEVFHHFTAVADATGLPVCIYNNPISTHFSFDDDLIARLAEVPNITALKTSSIPLADVAPKLARLRPRVPESFSLGFSGDRFCAQALLAGGDAWYCVMAGTLPLQTLALMRAVRSGDAAEVERLALLFQPLFELFDGFGGLRVMYAVAGILGLGEFELPRPIMPIPRSEWHRVEAAVERLSALGRA